jgi:hypothetical protein
METMTKKKTAEQVVVTEEILIQYEMFKFGEETNFYV